VGSPNLNYSLLQIRSLFSYFFTAQNEHGLHSPFVFDLYLNTIKKEVTRPDFEAIESIRRQMLQSREQLQITDYGAGSKVNTSPIREVRDVAQNSKKSARLGRLFYRLIQHFGYHSIFDLGTSLGLTTLYLSTANPKAKVTTFEGCPETAKVAKRNFEQIAANSQKSTIEIIVGNLDEVLEQEVAAAPKIDFVFFDANHRYEPTVRYFEICLAKAHNDSLFVFDDIHWSLEMEQAWEYIKAHPSVSVTIDLFAVGLVFFRQQQRKQNFVLRWPFWK
jgi:predicted O-methyltransferase YrrM